MPENVVVKVDAARVYFRDKPYGRPRGGQLFLTDQRLAFIYRGIFGIVNVDYSDNIEGGLRVDGSFAVALNMITEAKADSTLGTPYLKLRYQTPAGEEKSCSFYFTSKLVGVALFGLGGLIVGMPGLRKSPYEKMAEAIEQLKKTHEPSP